MAPKRLTDKQLGFNSNITRKDFINKTLLGVGGALLGASAPILSMGCNTTTKQAKDDWFGYGGVGDYTNAAGNTKAVMEAAHKIRDGVYSADFDFKDTGEIFDLVIVGGGMSGLGAAHYFKQNASENQTCLILENHSIFGGEAKRNEFLVNGHPLMGPQGSNDFGVPRKGSGSMTDVLFDQLQIPREFEFQKWGTDLKPLGFGLDNYAHMTGVAESKVDIGYFFDEGQGVSKPTWFNNIWRNDLENAPFNESVKKDLLKWRYYNSDQRGNEFRKLLDSMSYKEYLEGVLELSPEVTKYTDPVIGLINGASSDAVSALAAAQIGMPGTGRSRGKNASLPLSFPGGNTTFARYFVKDLFPGSIKGAHTFNDIINQPVNFSAFDVPESKIRMRHNATVVKVNHDGESDSSETVSVIYEKDGVVTKIKARSVVMASGGWVNKHIIKDLPQPILEAYNQFNYAPAMVANVALTNWRFMYDLGITAAQWFGDGFGFSCNIRKSMTIGDYNPPLHPDQPAVLTFYMGVYTPGLTLKEQGAVGRGKMLGTSFYDYERQLREQMIKQFSASGFNPEKDIAGIILNRWGHARLTQQPGFYFGLNGNPSPREVVSEGFGRIVIAHSELNGHQSWTGGVSQGYRGAEEALNRI